MKIAIQGIKGSFHHEVATQYFGEEIELIECRSFTQIPELLNSEKVAFAVMAIENSLAGAILPNYALIDDFSLQIQGEVHIPIHHNLMALEGQTLDNIKEVWSHPMALLQCRDFFRKHPSIKLIEATDTARAAMDISNKKLKGIAAVASKKASNIYNLSIIEDKIQTREHNYTRFFILTKQQNTSAVAEKNKASLKFITKHQTGSLADVLQVFSKNNISLTKIQSMPIIDQPWQYAFFTDVIFDDYETYQKSLGEVASKVNSLKVLGEYKKSKR